MADEKGIDASKLQNMISDRTGEFDARFLLWRTFCAENGIPVETLPGDLKGDVRQRWEKLKSERLSGE